MFMLCRVFFHCVSSLATCLTFASLLLSSVVAQEQEDPPDLNASLTGGLLVNSIRANPLTVNLAQTPISGFVPRVGMTLTNEFETIDDDILFFQADLSASPGGTKLSSSGSPIYRAALLDSGSQVDLLSHQATLDFGIAANGFGGTNTIPIGGATGLIDATIQDPLGVYAAGLQHATTLVPLAIPDAKMPGQTNVSVVSAPVSSSLPNVIGLPMISQYATVIRSDQPLIVDVNGETIRTPSIEFVELGTGVDQAELLGITRRAPMTFRPQGPSSPFLTPPLYTFTVDILGGGFDLHDNPTAPSNMAGGMFLTVDIEDDGNSLTDKKLFFDTGAEVSVVSQLLAAQLGFDATTDTPDFFVEIEGSGGLAGQVPGFVADEFHIVTIGGDFTLNNVPLVVLDIPDPSDPANAVSGIVGTNVFADRNLVIDPVPTIYGPGTPSLYISDPVLTVHNWNSMDTSGEWNTVTNWQAMGSPGQLWIADVAGVSGSAQQAVVSSNSTIQQLFVSGGIGQMSVVIEEGVTLTTFGHTTIQPGGTIHLNGGTVDSQAIVVTGGSISGHGSAIGNIDIEEGEISPGGLGPGNSAGILFVEGIFAQRAGATMRIEIGGLEPGDEFVDPQFDNLVVDGSVVIDGTLDVSLIEGFDPQANDAFEIITSTDGFDGMFSAANWPELDPGLRWGVESDGYFFTLEVVDTLPGDMNGDGALTEDDIGLFVLALTDVAAYRQQFPLLQFELLGDVNLDGSFDLGDVGAFSALSFGAGAAESVPEPSAALLLAAGAVFFPGRRRAAFRFLDCWAAA